MEGFAEAKIACKRRFFGCLRALRGAFGQLAKAAGRLLLLASNDLSMAFRHDLEIAGFIGLLRRYSGHIYIDVTLRHGTSSYISLISHSKGIYIYYLRHKSLILLKQPLVGKEEEQLSQSLQRTEQKLSLQLASEEAELQSYEASQALALAVADVAVNLKVYGMEDVTLYIYIVYTISSIMIYI